MLAADACADAGLTVATLSASTQSRLAELLPAGAALAGPVDTTAGVSGGTFRYCLEIVAADDGVDAVLVAGVPTAVADLTTAITAAAISKPVAVALLDQAEAVRLLPAPVQGDPARLVPAYAYPESAVRALGHAVRYQQWRDSPRGRLPNLADIDRAGARSLVSEFLSVHPDGGWLAEADAARLLGCYRIPMIATTAVSNSAAAVAAAAAFGAPVVLKAEVAGLVHKTDAGAVKLDLRSPGDVAAGYQELVGRFGDDLERVLLQPMLAGGVETLVGVVQEPVFGPLVVFGLGGVATEVLGDHVARLSPLTEADAAAMISGIHAAPLLTGHRGSPPVDTAGLAAILQRVSRLADDVPEVAELDLNPVIARPQDVQVVDVRIRVAPAAPRDPFLRRLR